MAFTTSKPQKNTSEVTVVNILCDNSGRVGPLSYLIPQDMDLSPGDAVEVPFGKRKLHGLVLGPGDPAKATREVIKVHGKRVSEEELEVAAEVAKQHFSDLTTVAARLAPKHGRGAAAFQAGPVELLGNENILPKEPEKTTRRLYLRVPTISTHLLAAQEAERISTQGKQVLILCPTIKDVEKMMAQFKSGAVRLDTKGPEGSWKGFSEGGVTIGIGTRAAALYSANDLGGIIVVEENHPGHQESSQPYTHARDLAALRTAKQGISLTLITANPSTSALGARIKVITVGGKRDWPKMSILDRNDFAPSERLIPGPLQNLINVARKEKTKIYVLSETRKAMRRCTKCFTPRPCELCTSSLCEHIESTKCVKCANTECKMFGWDKERVRKLLGPWAKPVNIKELSELENLNVPVVIYDIDQSFQSTALVQEALPSHIITSAARAAGKSGSLMVMTSQPSRTVLVDLVLEKDQRTNAKRMWNQAQEDQLPPFGRLVTISVGRTYAPSTKSLPGRVHGPRKTADGWEILVLCSDEQMDRLGQEVSRIRRGGKVRVTVL